MKIRINLTGGISLKSARPPGDGAFDFASGPVCDGVQDTWPVEDLSLDIYSRAFEGEFDVLAHALQLLRASASASALIDEAIQGGWEFGLSDLGERDFHVDVPGQKIIFAHYGMMPPALSRAPYFMNGLSVSMLRALRDIWHEKRHGGFDEKFGPEGILALERTRAADCDCYAVLCAWELRAAGYGDVWRHAIACEDGDVALAFLRTLEKSAISYPSQKAMAAAFAQWHRNAERVSVCEHEALEYIDELLRQDGRGKSFGPLAKAGAQDIEVLSCLPDRTAYLQDMGEEILRAPLYAGLTDPVNQTHYMQIMHDVSASIVQGVAFRDPGLAAKIFPGGEMTRESVSENFH